MLVDTKQILMEARSTGTAVPAPDCIDLDSIRVFISVAESLSKPVILSFAEVLTDMISLEEAAQITKLLARDAAVPIGLHLDHGSSPDVIRRAVDLGFTSVMIDASTKSFEENVAITRDVVRYAHARGVSVEAELGHVGQGSEYSSYDHSNNIYTETADAVRFTEKTGVDFLAVSIGTAHGQYQNMAKPTLNFERLRQLREVLDIPLVLHGGSGSGDDNLRRCAQEGIQKINIFTDFLTSAMAAIHRENPQGYLDLKRSANRAMEQTLRHYYEVFG